MELPHFLTLQSYMIGKGLILSISLLFRTQQRLSKFFVNTYFKMVMAANFKKTQLSIFNLIENSWRIGLTHRANVRIVLQQCTSQVFLETFS